MKSCPSKVDASVARSFLNSSLFIMSKSVLSFGKNALCMISSLASERFGLSGVSWIRLLFLAVP
jgi:hypothetical protein